MKDLRANLLLLVFTVAICCVLYPAILYAVGLSLFPTAASGGLIDDKAAATRDSARAIGSHLIAQPFSNDEYFWPRPSAAAYNATASGGSNLGSNNPKLRDRVCQFLAPIIAYKAGSKSSASTPQQDLEAWRTRLSLAADDPNLFDLWLSDPANATKIGDLEPVIVDMVTASGSGLDPHITLRNAMSVYQIDRVAAKRANSPADAESLKRQIADRVRSKAFTPLSGLIGEPLVNVLELNLELDRKFPSRR